MENSSIERSQLKKPYLKPKLRKVELKPEEAVLGNCKSGVTPGPGGTCSTPTACSTQGS
jgi:hypothetical protein